MVPFGSQALCSTYIATETNGILSDQLIYPGLGIIKMFIKDYKIESSTHITTLFICNGRKLQGIDYHIT